MRPIAWNNMKNKSIIPSQYEIVDAIYTNTVGATGDVGTQYDKGAAIDTELYGDKYLDFKVVCNIHFSDPGGCGWCGILGADEYRDSSKNLTIRWQIDNNIYCELNGKNNYNFIHLKCMPNEFHTIERKTIGQNLTFSVESLSETRDISNISEFTTSKTVYLGAIHSANRDQARACGYFEYKECIFSKNNIELAHFIPVYSKIDNKYGMYDIIRQKFFSSVTSHEFSIYHK